MIEKPPRFGYRTLSFTIAPVHFTNLLISKHKYGLEAAFFGLDPGSWKSFARLKA